MPKLLAVLAAGALCVARLANGAEPTTTPLATPSPTTQPAASEPVAPAEVVAPSRVLAVTIYQGTAQVTREVEVKQGKGISEIVVSPLPPGTIDGSLYTEGGDGFRILSTRFRTRAVLEDTRQEVRAKQDQMAALTNDNQQIQKQIEIGTENLAFIGKLENFTAATLQQLSEKGLLSAENTLKLADFVMTNRGDRAKAIVLLQQKLQVNTDAIAFAQRQLAELAAGANRTERDAIIVLDKAADGGGVVKLNYLVGDSTWHPTYRLRAGREKDPVELEYLAAIQQQSGEDWSGADVVLSTAQPMLTAVPPELLALDVKVIRGTENAAANNNRSKVENYTFARGLREQAQQAELQNDTQKPAAAQFYNSAAANEQFADLLAREDAPGADVGVKQGPSVAYHLPQKLTLPSRNDQQMVQVSRIDLPPSYFYKTVPVISPQVYRLAALSNQSQYVLLPGEATMYQGSDFVGRMSLPLVAIGEQFVVGFGVDPQIQVERQIVAKNHSIQGGNQVQTNDYRIRVSSFKNLPVQLQVWDRLPRGEAESVAVELIKSAPDPSTDAAYLRADRSRNLLRWDLDLKPGANAEQALTISYQFRLQYDRNVTIGNFATSR